jgi:CRISPR-associated exonuclease Cas4
MSANWWEEETAAEDEPVLLSMLEHYSYCPRQCALIHIEQVYDENVFTLKGSQGHERVDEPQSGESNGIRFERALPVYSRVLGLTGKADLVEFPEGVPYPVEYKHGGRGGRSHADLQLCGQALCLEEMFKTPVPRGAIYSIKSHKRQEVVLTVTLRDQTHAVIREVHELLRSGSMPAPVDDARCPNCSLIEVCQPKMFSPSNRNILAKEWKQCFAAEEPTCNR